MQYFFKIIYSLTKILFYINFQKLAKKIIAEKLGQTSKLFNINISLE